MSIGNTKDYGNKGNNFPYQIAALKLAGMSLMKNTLEVTITNVSAAGLVTDVNNYFISNPDKYLVSKSTIFDGTSYVAFLTIASNL